jgi:RND family efflux transporter MFP subunit
MKTRFWLIPAALLLGGAVLWEVTRPPAAPPAAPTPSVLVSTLRLTPGTLPATLTAYGSITAGIGAETTLSLQAGAIVASIDVIPGQRVAAGQRLATLEADAQSVADLQKATDALAAARANRAHITALLAAHLATAADLATADQAANDATSILAALKATGAGRTRPLNAPFPGIVSAVLVPPGAAQPAGTALLRLVNPDNFVATTSAPPDQAAAVTPGDGASLTPLNGGAAIAARVLQVSAVADPQTGLDTITLALAAPAPLGAPVAATITTGTLSGYVVPRDAIQTGTQGSYAFQVDARNIAHRVAVHVLGAQGQQSIIAADLNAALPFVATGAYQLDDGTAVRMAAPGGAAN